MVHAHVLTPEEKERFSHEIEAMIAQDPDLADRPRFSVALDEGGHPTGAVLPEPPDGPYISVWYQGSTLPDNLMTMSGAPLTDQMNPEHNNFDEGLESRNPRPVSVDPLLQGDERASARKAADAEAKKQADELQKTRTKEQEEHAKAKEAASKKAPGNH
jgi:hypothetical protein